MTPWTGVYGSSVYPATGRGRFFRNQWWLRALFDCIANMLARLPVFIALALPASKLWAADQRAFLTLSVNGIDCGTVMAILRPADVLLPLKDLEKAGLNVQAVRRESIGTATFVSLASLAPAFHYKLDQKKLSIAVTASAASFRPTNLDLANGPPPEMVFKSDPAGFLNYSVNTQNFDTVSGFFEAGVTVNHLLFYSGLSLDMASLVRGLTNITWDDPKNLRSLILGDTALRAPVLGGGPFIGGLTFQKNFNLDPYFIQFPTQTVSGSVTSPSTAYVYRNGILIEEVQLPPGEFNLRQIPGLSGVSDTQVIIKNAFGGSQIINAPYYVGATLLQPGLSSYQYSFGEERYNLGTRSWAYGPLALSASHSIGLASWITPGYRLEATADSISGGPQVTLGSSLGLVQLAVAGSTEQGESGAAAAFLYQYVSPRINVNSQIQWMSPHYSNLSLAPWLTRPIVQTNNSVGCSIGAARRATFQLQHIYSRDRNTTGGTVLHQVLESLYFTLSERVNLSVNFSQGLPGNQMPAYEMFAGLSYYFGNATTAMASYEQQQSQSSGVGFLQKSLPFGPGYGYLLQARGGSGGQSQQVANFQYQTDQGYYEADYTHLNGQHSGALTLAGGVIGIGGRLFLTRPVEQGFALVRVPGVKDVACEWSNQLIGRTDGAGDCLYPNLLPYYGNLLGIDDKNIPMNYSVGATKETVAVPNRGGAVIKFPVHRVHQVTGRIVIMRRGKNIVPTTGLLTVWTKPERTSPLGDAGNFYFQDLPVGTHRAHVDYDGGACSFDLVVPEFKETLHKLGIVRCIEQ